MPNKNKENKLQIEVLCDVLEFHEQGFPEIIEIKFKNKKYKYQHIHNNTEKRIDKYITKILKNEFKK